MSTIGSHIVDSVSQDRTAQHVNIGLSPNRDYLAGIPSSLIAANAYYWILYQ